MNKYEVILPNPVIATGNGVLETGITGARWVGTNPDEAGAAGNFAAADGLIYSDAIVANSTDTALTKIVTLSIPALTAGKDNAVQVTLSALECSTGITVFGIKGLGIVDMAAGATVVSNPTILDALNYSIVRSSVIVLIPTANIAHLENKKLNIMLYYR